MRIQIGRLRRSLDKYYSIEGKNDPIRFSIPIGNYTPIFVPISDQGLELSEGFKKSKLSSSEKPSIVVFPFTNLTGDEEQEYFVSGLTEEVSIELTRYEDFRIVGFRIKDKFSTNILTDIKLINDLGANFIIHGSVRKDNYHIKVSIKLIDARTSEQLWGEQFKRKLDPSNLIAIQENIASETVTIIANEYGIIPQKIAKEARKKAPKELDTYEAILKYYHYQIHHTPETAQEAFIALENAASKNPESGVALAMLASLYGTSYELDLSDRSQSLEKLIELTNKSVELEPNNQLVRIIYAWRYFVLNQKELFFSEMDKALALNPNSSFRIGAIGFFLSLYGEWEKGKQLLDMAMKQNVGYPSWYYGATAVYYYRLNEYGKAYEEALKYDVPAIFWGPMLRIATLGQLGRPSDIEKQISDLKTLKPDFETEAQYLISRYVKEDDLVEKIIEGLRKGGLKI